MALWATVAGLVVVASGFTYYYLTRDKGTDSPFNNNSKKPDGQPPTDKFRCINSSYPLGYGTCHQDVKLLQKHLNKYNKVRLTVDGKFGTITLNASKKHLNKSSFSKEDINRIINYSPK